MTLATAEIDRRDAFAPATEPPRDGAQGGELRRLQGLLLQAVTSQRDQVAAFRSVARIIAPAAGATQIVYVGRDELQRLTEGMLLHPADGAAAPAGRTAHVAASLRDANASLGETRPRDRSLLQCCATACRKGQLHVSEPSDEDDAYVLGLPIPRRGGPPDALALVAVVSQSRLTHTSMVLQLAGAHLVMWYLLNDTRRAEAEAGTAAAVLELVEQVERAEGLDAGCQIVTSRLQQFLGCQQVAIGVCRPGKRTCRLEAVAGVDGFDRRSELARALQSALDEAVLREATLVWPPRDDADRQASLAHQRLLKVAASDSLISAPLRDDSGQVRGAWLFLGWQQSPRRDELVHLAEITARSLAGSLRLLQASDRGPVARAVKKTCGLLRHYKGRVVLAAAGLALAALWLPVQHRVDCQCRLEPVLRRYVASPYEGVLEKAVVQPGDLVAADDLMAQLDGREIRWELAGLRADHDQAAKKRDTALAAQRFAEAQLAKLEMERLDQKIRVLEHRQEHLAVKCPLDGIVIGGDLERTQGAPVTLGQRLFEVAPLDEMVVEIAVPQDDIAYVVRGMEVTVRLDAYPHEPRSSTIHQIRPRAQILDERNVFVAEVRVDNADRRVRPGMTGRVQIQAGRRALGWVWLHKPWESLLRLGGW